MRTSACCNVFVALSDGVGHNSLLQLFTTPGIATFPHLYVSDHQCGEVL